MIGERSAQDTTHSNSESLGGEWRHVFLLSSCLFVFFALFAYLYAKNGGNWVDSLDERNGEIVAKRAESVGTAGRLDESIRLYEDALAAGFQAPDQFVWVRQKYIVILLEAGQYERAEVVAGEVLDSGVPEIADWVGRQAFSRVHSAVSSNGLHEMALAMSERWYDAGVRCNNNAAQGQGMYLKGQSLRALGRDDEARAAFSAALDTTPTPEMKSAIDQALRQAGR